MNIWLVMLAGGLLTFGMRFSLIYLFGRMEVPALLQRSLRFVPPAVLSAIVLPDVLLHAGSLDLSAGNERMLAGAIAVLVAWKTRSMLVTIAAGMAALLLIRQLL
jgi:branched-subunit amino acid transport protein